MDLESAKLIAGGKIVIPARFRRALGLKDGDRLVLDLLDGEIRIRTLDQSIDRSIKIAAKYMPVDVSLADQLVAERHAIADR